jgi:hypothetical protein
MIAHVAAAGEGRGRVVLRFCTGTPSEAAIRAAFRLAQAFQSEIESLYIEDRQLLELASYPFATEISFTGRTRRRLTHRAVQQSFRSVFVAARRHVDRIAREVDVPRADHFVRDEPVHALAAACARSGPWNIIALAEAFGASSCGTLRELFDTVPDTTGVVLVGPNTSRTTGPVVIVVEDLDRFPGMLRAAERIAALGEVPVRLLLVAGEDEDLYRMDGEVRLVLEGRQDVSISHCAMARGEAAVVAEAIRRLGGGFLIARFGGLAVPDSGSLRPLVSALECPLLLVR